MQGLGLRRILFLSSDGTVDGISELISIPEFARFAHYQFQYKSRRDHIEFPLLLAPDRNLYPADHPFHKLWQEGYTAAKHHNETAW